MWSTKDDEWSIYTQLLHALVVDICMIYVYGKILLGTYRACRRFRVAAKIKDGLMYVLHMMYVLHIMFLWPFNLVRAVCSLPLRFVRAGIDLWFKAAHFCFNHEGTFESIYDHPDSVDRQLQNENVEAPQVPVDQAFHAQIFHTDSASSECPGNTNNNGNSATVLPVPARSVSFQTPLITATSAQPANVNNRICSTGFVPNLETQPPGQVGQGATRSAVSNAPSSTSTAGSERSESREPQSQRKATNRSAQSRTMKTRSQTNGSPNV